jgi:hypothetical protein
MAREKKKTQSEENNAQTGIPSGHALALYAASIDLNGLARLADTCGVAVVALEAIWDGVTVGFSPVAPSLQELPACVLGFVATSAAGAHEVELMRKAWARQFNREAPDALTVALPLDDVAVLGWIARRLVDAQRQMAERNTALMRDMYVIRSEHEAVQEAFQRLENYAYASSMLTRQLALCLEPHESAVKVGKGRTGEVRQLLPISSSGLCDVAIHLTQVSRDAHGRLDISLLTLEDGQTVGKWTLSASQMRPGWLRLGLEQALSADGRSIALILQWTGTGEIGLSLASPHPEPRWCAQAGGTATQGPLGVKLWRCFPGTRAVPAARASMNASTEPQTLMLYADTLRKVENLGAIPDGIAFDQHWNSLLVHPVAGKPTWARLNNAVPEGVSRIYADIETRNDKAGPVEYVLAVAPATDKARKSKALQFKPGLISEWVRVDTTMQSQVHLNLDAAVQADFDLYLGTRLPPGATNAFCWAHFSKIRMSR